LPYYRFFSGQPNLIMLLILAWAMDSNLDESVMWAFISGILQDTLSIVPIGTSIAPLLLGILLISLVRSQLEGFGFVVYVIVVLMCLFVHQVLSFITVGLTGYAIDLIPTIRYFMLPSFAYQIILMPVAYFMTRIIERGLAPRRLT
jgi:rod shape-determining protein MreD